AGLCHARGASPAVAPLQSSNGDCSLSIRRHPVVIAPRQAVGTSNAFDRRIFMRFALALMMMPLLPLAALPTPAIAEAPPATTQDEALLRFLDDAFDARIALQPEIQTHLGLKSNYDRLDDYTDAAAVREQALIEQQLKEMKARFRPEQLGPSARVSYRLFEY